MEQPWWADETNKITKLSSGFSEREVQTYLYGQQFPEQCGTAWVNEWTFAIVDRLNNQNTLRGTFRGREWKDYGEEK